MLQRDEGGWGSPTESWDSHLDIQMQPLLQIWKNLTPWFRWERRKGLESLGSHVNGSWGPVDMHNNSVPRLMKTSEVTVRTSSWNFLCQIFSHEDHGIFTTKQGGYR